MRKITSGNRSASGASSQGVMMSIIQTGIFTAFQSFPYCISYDITRRYTPSDCLDFQLSVKVLIVENSRHFFLFMPHPPSSRLYFHTHKHCNNGQRECQGKSLTKWRPGWCAKSRLNKTDKCAISLYPTKSHKVKFQEIACITIPRG